jgi:hypothetical protein
MLTSKQRRTLLAWADGKSGPEIAAAEGITRVAAHYRITSAIRRLRELAGVDETANCAGAGAGAGP